MKVSNIIRRLKAEEITNRYSEKGRLIPQQIYVELKKKKTCHICKEKFKKNKKPELHHIIPVRKGGEHTKENIIAICKVCHKNEHKTENL